MKDSIRKVLILLLFMIGSICSSNAQPCNPKFLNVTKTAQDASSVTLAWNSLNPPAGYDVSFLIPGQQEVPVTNTFATNLKIFNLVAGTNYTFFVATNGLTCFNSHGIEIQADVAGEMDVTMQPPAPVGVTGGSVGENGFTVSWSPAFGATSYQLDISTDPLIQNSVTTLNGITESTKSVTGLTAGTVHHFQVRAVNSGGVSGNSDKTSQVTIPTKPVAGQPSLIAADSFTANWATSVGATSFRLDVSTDQNFTSMVDTYNNVDVNGLSYKVSNLTNNGVNYYYRVRAVNSAGVSTSSDPVQLTILPPPPVSLATSGVTTSSFLATWQAAFSAVSYRMDVSADESFSSFVDGFNNLTVNGTSQSVTGLSAGVTYFFRVRSLNQSGVSKNSSETHSQITVPPAPSAIAATPVTGSSFVANWNATPGATSYQLDVAFNDDTFSTLLTGYNSIPVDGTTSSVTGLNTGSTYYYRVRAVNAAGVSSNSSAIEVLTLPATPTSFDVTSNPTSLGVRWLSVPTAHAYEILVSRNEAFTDLVENYSPGLIADATNVNIQGLTPLTIYYLQLRAKNNAGYSAYSAPKIVSTISTTGPVPIQFNALNYPASYQEGSSGEISFSVSGGTGAISVTLFRKDNSSLNYLSENVPVVNDGLKIRIDDSWLDDFGMQFYLEARDLAGQAKKSTNSDNPHVVLSAVPKVSIPLTSFGKELKNYQMISIPFKLRETKIADIFEPIIGEAYNKAHWRLVHFTDGKNQDYEDGLSVSRIEQGKSYWFVSKNPVDLSFGVGTSYGNDVNTPFTMILKKGWNQIGNPFPYDLSWNQILTSNNHPDGVGNLEIFLQESGSFEESDVLPVFGGGFVFADEDTELKIPVQSVNHGGRIGSESAGTTNVPSGWMLPFRLTQQGITSTQSGIGMRENAKEGKDEWDRVTPPRFIRYLEFNSRRPGYDYDFSRDIVSLRDQYAWEFSVTSDVAGPVKLQWNKATAQAVGGELILHDLSANILLDMSKSDEYIATEKSNFLIHYNHVKTLEEELVVLGVPYPNPFQVQATIPFGYSDNFRERSDATLQIRDLGGKLILSMSHVYDAGRAVQSFQWNGQTQEGNVVPAGLYVYQVFVTSAGKTIVHSGKLIKQ